MKERKRESRRGEEGERGIKKAQMCERFPTDV